MPAQFSYMVQQPDGSVETHQSEADRPPTWGELADHVASTGATLMPATPAEPPAAASAAPPPAPTVPAAAPDAAPAAPSLGQRAKDTLFPARTFWSQMPSIGGAIGGAEIGAGVGALGGPAAVVTIPAGAIAGAALGSGAGEAVRVGAEKLLGWQPAEPGTLGERVGNAAIRGGAFEGATLPLRVAAVPLLAKTMAPAQAAADLAPVLAQDLPAEVKAVQAADGSFRRIGHLLNDPAQLTQFAGAPGSQETLMRAWWQQNAPLGAAHVATAWDALGKPAQLALTGDQHLAMNTLVNTLKAGSAPLTGQGVGPVGETLLGAGVGALHGMPILGTAAGVLPTAARVANKALPYGMSQMLLTPGGAATLGWLPKAGAAAVPWASTGLRTAAQLAGPFVWPSADTMLGPPPP